MLTFAICYLARGTSEQYTELQEQSSSRSSAATEKAAETYQQNRNGPSGRRTDHSVRPPDGPLREHSMRITVGYGGPARGQAREL